MSKSDNELLLSYLDKLAADVNELRKALGRDIKRGIRVSKGDTGAKVTPTVTKCELVVEGLDSNKWKKLRDRTREVLANTPKPAEGEDCTIICKDTRFKILIY